MENIEAHIQKDKEILQDPTTNHKCVVTLRANYMNWKSMWRITKKKSRLAITMIPQHWNFTVKWNQMLTSVECTTTDD